MSQKVAQVAPAVHYNSKQYDRIRFLGKGSFGSAVVHRRRHDCSLVVLKEIDLKRFKGEREKWSAINEARIMSTLNHVNIIKYHNAYTTETKLIIEMEYASMGSLAVYLSYQIQPLEEQEILVIYRQIVSGLNYLHSRNIIHLDLKMGNIFVTIEGLVKIGDFGISQYIDTQMGMMSQQCSPDVQAGAGVNSRKGFLMNQPQRHQAAIAATSSHFGTLAYSSPERCLGELTDFKSDIWSLGCILYELITNEPLFVGNSLAELVLNITQIHYKSIKRNISQALLDIFERSISRYPEDRPNAKDLLCATDQFLSRIQVLKHRVSKRQTNTRHSRFDLSTEVALLAAQNHDDMSKINYLHSLVYQVRLNARHIQVDRVNLPQSKRIKEISKGRSHYLVLTYDNIVYGWGSKTYGQLGACGLTSSTSNKWSRSARSSTTNASTKSFISTGPDSQQNQNQNPQSSIYASSVASSLASSTQTLSPASNLAAATTTSKTSSSCGLQQQQQQHLNKQLVMSMLKNSEPTSKPFVINELNHRKIIQVAAGDNFSVFLSKTGIVMTCGDGSSGCLGRGDLRSCFTPSMVESLLNSDVVSISCGPKHVIAVCGNGRAFAWGKNRHGRLGIGGVAGRSLPSSTSISASSFNYKQTKQVGSSSAKYILRPLPVLFNEDIFVKNVFCGDKCTVFIDSDDRAWACGENRFNKLGVDIKRRFKKPLIVTNCFQPMEISSLSKYKIVTCNIGKNHSTFISSEGKVFVFGQDVEHKNDNSSKTSKSITSLKSYKRRISVDLPLQQGINHQQVQLDMNSTKSSSSHYFSNKRQSTDNLSKYSLQCRSVKHNYCASNHEQSEQQVSKSKRRQFEPLVRQSRAFKKMSFESVISVGSTARFTLALTNDNRVYFWGIRSHTTKSDKSSGIIKNNKKKEVSVEPQLVSVSSDECFIKIGGTNNSLMSNIQISGSDQPIIQAQDPRLKANSLSDLWILDYKPSSSTSASDDDSETSLSKGSCSSMSSCSLSCSLIGKESSLHESGSECSLCSACYNQLPDCVHQQCSCEEKDEEEEEEDIKYDAILEPQPIVSLYVPSMFNHNGCSLHMVDLFCFDEDRFYLILDTTIKLQHNSSRQASLTSSNSIASSHPSHSSPKSIRRSSSRFIKQTMNIKQSNKEGNDTSYAFSPNATSPIKNQVRSSNNAQCYPNEQQQEESCCLSRKQVGDKSSDSVPTITMTSILTNKLTVLNESAESASTIAGNYALVSKDQQMNQAAPEFSEKSSLSSSYDGNNNDLTQSNMILSFSQGGASLEEPRSISTLATSLGNQIIVGSSMRNLEARENDQPLEPLLFTHGHLDQQIGSSSRDEDGLEVINDDSYSIRGRGRGRDKSESNTTNLDETSSMPSWVKNEYIQQCQQIDTDSLFVDKEMTLQDGEYGIFAIESSTTTDAEDNNLSTVGIEKDDCLDTISDDLTIKADPKIPSNRSSRSRFDTFNGSQNLTRPNSIITTKFDSTNTSLYHESFLLNDSLTVPKVNSFSQSQPDISELLDYGNLEVNSNLEACRGEVAKSASMLMSAKAKAQTDDVTAEGVNISTNKSKVTCHTSPDNLLQCNVYRGKAADAHPLNHSALSSRSISNNTLVSTSHLNRSTLNFENQLSNRATINGPLMLEAANFHVYPVEEQLALIGTLTGPGSSGISYVEQIERQQQQQQQQNQDEYQLIRSGSIDYLASLKDRSTAHHKPVKRSSSSNIKTKTLSSSSLSSMRKSLVKLFC